MDTDPSTGRGLDYTPGSSMADDASYVTGASRDDAIQDTSFITADDASLDGYAAGDADSIPRSTEHLPSSRSMPVPSIHRSTENIPSSRSMPVPEYLETRAESSQRAEPKDEEAPPPTYEEAVGEVQDGDGDGPTSDGANGGGDDNALSPDEVAVVMRMQANRGDYLDDELGSRRGSYEEAIEMISKDDANDTQAESPAPAAATVRFDHPDSAGAAEEGRRASFVMEDRDADRGRSRREGIWKLLGNPTPTRVMAFSLLIILAIGLLLFVSLFPASFVYVDYHEIAMKQSKLTNYVDRDTVYYTGCYVLGPDTRMLKFVSSNNNINDEMSVFTTDTIAITMRFSLEYFIRPGELGQLYTMFVDDYDPVFRLIVKSTLRVLSGTTLTVENFRFNRTYVEKTMHAAVRKKLGGDCCPKCCPDRCQSNSYCSMCRHESCDQGYHVDVRYFHLLTITIPDEVFELYLSRTIQEIEKEREFFIQEHAVTEKETKMLTDRLKNEANEITERGRNEARTIQVVSAAAKEKQVQSAYVTAVQGLYSRLNVTKEEHKTSLMMIRALEDSIDNLYAGYGYDQHTLSGP